MIGGAAADGEICQCSESTIGEEVLLSHCFRGIRKVSRCPVCVSVRKLDKEETHSTKHEAGLTRIMHYTFNMK